MEQLLYVQAKVETSSLAASSSLLQFSPFSNVAENLMPFCCFIFQLQKIYCHCLQSTVLLQIIKQSCKGWFLLRKTLNKARHHPTTFQVSPDGVIVVANTRILTFTVISQWFLVLARQIRNNPKQHHRSYLGGNWNLCAVFRAWRISLWSILIRPGFSVSEKQNVHSLTGASMVFFRGLSQSFQLRPSGLLESVAFSICI